MPGSLTKTVTFSFVRDPASRECIGELFVGELLVAIYHHPLASPRMSIDAHTRMLTCMEHTHIHTTSNLALKIINRYLKIRLYFTK